MATRMVRGAVTLTAKVGGACPFKAPGSPGSRRVRVSAHVRASLAWGDAFARPRTLVPPHHPPRPTSDASLPYSRLSKLAVNDIMKVFDQYDVAVAVIDVISLVEVLINQSRLPT